MVEERNENLQDADGKNEQPEASIKPETNTDDVQPTTQTEEKTPKEEVTTESPEEKVEQVSTEESEKAEEPVVETIDITEDNEESLEDKVHQMAEEKSAEEVVDEIEQTMASESEEVPEKVAETHDHVPLLSYHTFDLKTLIEEGQKLLSEHPVQKIKKNFDEIKAAFENKVDEMILKYKEANPDDDEGMDIPEQKEFRYLWRDYRDKYHQFRKKKQEELEENLKNRHQIIDDLKALIDSTEYSFEERLKKFKEIQKSWRSAGSIPSAQYSDMWKTFHHHEERFYDLLDLDRDYRDKVFEENLKEKQSIIEQAKSLLELNDIHKIFKDLQLLHKKWKEETGPVARDKREAIWDEFKDVTKQIHDKRREFYKHLKEEFNNNLVKKREIIEQLKEVTAEIPENHKEWQKKIKIVEELREAFYQIGYVPKKYRDEIWDGFKGSIKEFNKYKNDFYKSLKALQKENLDKKMALIKIAEKYKDSEEWEEATEKFKEIQEKWKQIGHVPRKYSEKIWQEFRAACNHYFDRFHAQSRKEKNAELDTFFAKKDYFQKLKDQFKDIDENATYTIDDIKKLIGEWKELGFVPAHKNYINVKFNKFINSLYDKLKIDKRELSFLKFKNTVDDYFEQENYRKLDSEKRFVRQKIEGIEKEIQQLENNMMFIKSDDKNNPFKREVDKNIANNREILEFWKKKQKYLNSLKY